MGYNCVTYEGVNLGLIIESSIVLNLNKYKSEYCIDPGELEYLSEKLEKSFHKFLKKKFGDSIPEGFLFMKFGMFYNRLISKYETGPCGYPLLALGYNLHGLLKEPKNLNSIGDVNLFCSFPSNCLNILAEFYAEYKLKKDRKINNAKWSKSTESSSSSSSSESSYSESPSSSSESSSSESTSSSSSETSSSESSDGDLSESEVEKLKKIFIKEISYGLNGFVSIYL